MTVFALQRLEKIEATAYYPLLEEKWVTFWNLFEYQRPALGDLIGCTNHKKSIWSSLEIRLADSLHFKITINHKHTNEYVLFQL